MTIQVHWPDGTVTDNEPDKPIVLLGPNGVGKTRFSVDLAARSQADRISANRSIALTTLPRQSETDLQSNMRSALDSQRNQYWNVHNEYTFLMAQILEEDKSRAQQYRDRHLRGEAIPAEIITTRQKTITTIWESIFPGRVLHLDYEPTVVRDEATPYPTAQMSEGERTALYLITRIVSSSSAIIVVDEPEIHFHPLLARQFWTSMEKHKPGTLFIYVTHDIPFALSRNNPLIYVVRSPGTFDKIDDADIPADAINTILGAASFSISARRLIFCEGTLDGPDHKLFKAWYSDLNAAVIPVKSCTNVRQCVDVFNSNHATKNVRAVGHIDRDDWSEVFLNSHPEIKPLPVNEIEGIICFEPIFKALATYYGHNDGNTRFTRFTTSARKAVDGIILNKHALNRAKLALELKQQAMRNLVNPHPDRATMMTQFLSGVTSGTEAQAILTTEITELTAAQTNDNLLLKFPAKTYRGGFTPEMGVTADKAFDDICAVLAATDENLANDAAKLTLKNAVIAALAPHLFPRVEANQP